MTPVLHATQSLLQTIALEQRGYHFGPSTSLGSLTIIRNLPIARPYRSLPESIVRIDHSSWLVCNDSPWPVLVPRGTKIGAWFTRTTVVLQPYARETLSTSSECPRQPRFGGMGLKTLQAGAVTFAEGKLAYLCAFDSPITWHHLMGGVPAHAAGDVGALGWRSMAGAVREALTGPLETTLRFGHRPGRTEWSVKIWALRSRKYTGELVIIGRAPVMLTLEVR